MGSNSDVVMQSRRLMKATQIEHLYLPLEKALSMTRKERPAGVAGISYVVNM